MIGHFIVFLKTFFFQYKTEILLSFIFFYCIFLCFIVFSCIFIVFLTPKSVGKKASRKSWSRPSPILTDLDRSQSPAFFKLPPDIDLNHALHPVFLTTKGYPFYANDIEVVYVLLLANA